MAQRHLRGKWGYSGDLCHVLDILAKCLSDTLCHYALCRTTSCLRNAHGRVKTPPGSLSPHLLNMGLHGMCARKLLMLCGVGREALKLHTAKKGSRLQPNVSNMAWHQTHTSFGQPILKHMSNPSCLVMCHTKRSIYEQASFPSGK